MFIGELLVQPLQHRDVRLKVFIVVSYVDERAKDVCREDDLESFPVLFNAVQEAKCSEAVEL